MNAHQTPAGELFTQLTATIDQVVDQVMTHKGQAFELAFKHRELESGPEVYRACDVSYHLTIPLIDTSIQSEITGFHGIPSIID